MRNDVQRTIKKYETTVIALVDCSKALSLIASSQNCLSVLEFLLKRYVGHNYKIVKQSSTTN